MTREPLVCPSCARPHGGDERFCADCGMPLVYAGDEPVTGDAVSERHERARKIKPQLAEGDLVRVVGARNQTEGEFIQGLLLEEGVPSILRRAAGFDVPDFLAAGPRDVLVPQAGATTAREVLLQAELMPSGVPVGPAPGRLLLGLLIAVALVAVVAWLGTELI
jgi:hypothetical protein